MGRINIADDRDRRVRKEGKGYTVTVDGVDYSVLPSDTFAWGIYTGPNLDLIHDGRGNFAYGYRTAQAAIEALIPDTTGRRAR